MIISVSLIRILLVQFIWIIEPQIRNFVENDVLISVISLPFDVTFNQLLGQFCNNSFMRWSA